MHVNNDQANPLYTQLTGSNVRENPFQTPFGQEIVSIEESYESRLYRQGRPQSSFLNGTTIAANSTNASGGSLYPSPGCDLTPFFIVFSADQQVVLNISFATELSNGTDKNGTFYMPIIVNAGQPVTLRFNGEVKLHEHGVLQLLVTTGANATKIYSSMYGVEVTTNA